MRSLTVEARGALSVARRIGSGETTIRIEVTREDASFAVKVVRTSDPNGRLAAEAKPR